MYRTLIVPLDGSVVSEHALAVAADVMRATDGRLVTVSATLDDFETAYREQHIKEVLTDLDLGSAEIRAMPHPSAAGCILEAAAHEPDPLVVMGTHGRSGIGAVLIGSVTEEVIRRWQHPTLLVGPDCREAAHPTSGRLLMTVDGSPASEAAVEPAIAWASQFGMEASIVSVIDPELPTFIANTLPPGDLNETGQVHRVARRFEEAGVPADWEVLHGAHVATVLADYIAELPADLVVMSTHGRTGLARVAVGSVAMGVVHRARCPVLVVRPRDLG